MACSIRVHFNPSVQAAGEDHPTDLKSGSVGSKRASQSPGKTAGSLNRVEWAGVRGDGVGRGGMRQVKQSLLLPQ